MDRADRRRTWGFAGLALAGLVALFTAAAQQQQLGRAEAAVPPVAANRAPPALHEPIQPVPPVTPQDPRKVGLGARLFADPRLSSDGSVSCATCHDLARGGADGRSLSIGARGAVTAVNTPTIFNVSLNPKQHWDGRADLLDAQLAEPMTSPRIMNTTWPVVVATLSADPVYGAGFARAYGGPVTEARVRDAMAAYERTLVLRDSPFDRYLAGDASALGHDEREGFALFKSYGCASCHQGRNVGGNVFEVLGIVGDYFAARGTPITTADLGRFNVTKRAEDRHRFRVPSLRAAVLTAPYLHDGTAVSLADAIVTMGRFQLGAEIPPGDVQLLETFLRSLVGTYVPAEAAGP